MAFTRIINFVSRVIFRVWVCLWNGKFQGKRILFMKIFDFMTLGQPAQSGGIINTFLYLKLNTDKRDPFGIGK